MKEFCWKNVQKYHVFRGIIYLLQCVTYIELIVKLCLNSMMFICKITSIGVLLRKS